VTAIFGYDADHGQAIDHSVLRRAEAFVDPVVAPRVIQTRREEDRRTLRVRAEMGRNASDVGYASCKPGGWRSTASTSLLIQDGAG
jgi:hypothetical protein